MKRKISVVCILIASFFFGMLLFDQCRAESPINFNGHTVSLYEGSVTCTEPLYYPQMNVGDQVMAWVTFTNPEAGTFEWRWIKPNGEILPITLDFPAIGPSCRWCWTSVICVTMPGKYRVEYYFNGVFLDASDTFTALSNIQSKLGVTVYPASVGKVTGPGINCGSDCEESYPAGETITLNALPNAGWKLNYLMVGDECYVSDSVSVVMDKDQTVVASFWPASDKYLLTPVDATPLGNRLPLVFIHGNNIENEAYPYRWEKYIKAINSNKTLRKKFKMYLFRWDSSFDDLTGGLALGVLLDQHSELQDKKILFVGHSRGGIIARYFMNYYQMTQGVFKGKSGGEKVKKLLTLATPHHGSPGADRWWVDLTVNDVYKSDPDLAYLVSWAYFNVIWEPSFQYLLWDDANQELTHQAVQWNSAYLGANQSRKVESAGVSDTYKLNQEERYFSKIVAFGGNNTRLDLDIWEVVTTAIGIVGDNHAQLDLSSLLMANMPMVRDKNDSVWIDTSSCHFMANDGLAPLFSALCLKKGYEDIFRITNRGDLVFSAKKLAQARLVKKMIPFRFLVDHQDFLDKPKVISRVITEISQN